MDEEQPGHCPQGTKHGKVSSDDEQSAEEDEPSSPIQQHPAKKRSCKEVDAALLEYLKISDKQTVDLTAKYTALSNVHNEKQAYVDWLLQVVHPMPCHLWREFTREAFGLVSRLHNRMEMEQSSTVLQP